MSKSEIVKECLMAFGTTSVDDLTDDMIVGMMSMIAKPGQYGAATIYDESDEEERKRFIADSKRCIEGACDIEYYMVNREGVRTEENEEYFDWTSRHSVWYRVIANR